MKLWIAYRRPFLVQRFAACDSSSTGFPDWVEQKMRCQLCHLWSENEIEWDLARFSCFSWFVCFCSFGETLDCWMSWFLDRASKRLCTFFIGMGKEANSKSLWYGFMVSFSTRQSDNHRIIADKQTDGCLLLLSTHPGYGPRLPRSWSPVATLVQEENQLQKFIEVTSAIEKRNWWHPTVFFFLGMIAKHIPRWKGSRVWCLHLLFALSMFLKVGALWKRCSIVFWLTFLVQHIMVSYIELIKCC